VTRVQARCVVAVAGVLSVVLLAQAASAAGAGMRSSRLTTLEAPMALSPTSTPEETATTTTTAPPTTTTTAAAPTVEVTLTAVSDTYANKQQATTAHGAATSMLVNGHPNQTKHAFVRFDLSGIPSGATVEAASLTLRRSVTTTGTYTLDRAATAWTEAGLTWATAPDVTGTGHARASSTTSVTWSSAGLVADVASMVASPSKNHGWRVAAGANGDVAFAAREGSPTLGPTLVVTYVAP
jgi:flagellar capping protein FliD